MTWAYASPCLPSATVSRPRTRVEDVIRRHTRGCCKCSSLPFNATQDEARQSGVTTTATAVCLTRLQFANGTSPSRSGRWYADSWSAMISNYTVSWISLISHAQEARRAGEHFLSISCTPSATHNSYSATPQDEAPQMDKRTTVCPSMPLFNDFCIVLSSCFHLEVETDVLYSWS